jgi:hypothetical protein
LLLVLAFLSHDLIMATPAPAVAAQRPSLALTQDAPAIHAPSPHGCMIVRPAALETQKAPLGHPTLSGVMEHGIASHPYGLPSCAGVTQARSPTAPRALWQVFRI